ncbi:hypothetical protein RYH73_00845 [Olivibacter sp. CPCC 100613]|uniref:hypothetical protein n=1 Tax=Olivibacter sp. CPCC 100613 TaxID=3079931 RepID=UPI002FF92AE2
MEQQNLKKRINILTAYVVISTSICLFLAFSAFRTSERKEKFDELEVKRINVVGEKGDIRMVISNETRQHNGVLDGIAAEPRKREAGIIFFNTVGDECGGLVFNGDEKDAGLVLSVDQFRNDQVMQLQYMENTENKDRKYGLQLWEYPKEVRYKELLPKFNQLKGKSKEEQKQMLASMRADSLLSEDRLFLGRDFNKNVGLFIKDDTGRPRIKIYIDAQNRAKVEFLNEKGELVKELL